ncbi:hypothetical protein [Pseudooceanicola sp. LIPI14-2-Ac024]|uniref:hypothetical protein n=1 Tax=Pseudooceanicola sp. LIPI14-2-Ac024 TaxID=3344875 RepID=UPI0035D0A58B
MLSRTIPTPTIEVGASTLSLTVGFTKHLCQTFSTEYGKSSSAAVAKADPATAYDNALQAVEDYKAILKADDAQRAFLMRVKLAIAVMEDGTVPVNGEKDPLIATALNAKLYASHILKHNPDSALASIDYSDTLEELKLLKEALQDAITVTEDRLERCKVVLQRSAKAAFAFSPDFDLLLEAGLEKHLPPRWSNQLERGTAYGKATQDQWDENEANLNASIVQLKFRKFLTSEIEAAAAKRQRSREELDAYSLNQDLKELYQ